ncbi:hypothetical protein [Furfurilactobacillus entadae]|uniref:hypothetical protein n=1 Tax=Furfurilactobacillus entadae TaxID=2922307 RepID=UPI0035EB878D
MTTMHVLQAIMADSSTYWTFALLIGGGVVVWSTFGDRAERVINWLDKAWDKLLCHL